MAGSNVTATVSNPHPHQNTRVTVEGDIGGKDLRYRRARMIATWHFRTKTVECQADADEHGYGTASCTRDIGRATKGFTVVIDVVFIDRDTGESYGNAQVGFTPQ